MAQEESRLFIVSNRLPVTITKNKNGSYDFKQSSGGLVAGLKGLSKSQPFQWFGWPGMEIPADEIEPLKKKLADEYDAVPVFLQDDMAELHYNGFSSTIQSLLILCLLTRW